MLTPDATIIIAALSALAGGMLTVLILRVKYARLRVELESLQNLRTENGELQKNLQNMREEAVRFEEQRRMSSEKLAWTEQAEQRLREAFTSLSSNALKSNADDLQKRHSEMLENFKKRFESDLQNQHRSFKGLVEPVSKEIQHLDQQVRELEKNRQGAYEGLRQQITHLLQDHQELRNSTNNLTNALKSSTARGKWGEVQLRRIAEMAGMIDHVDFNEQQQTEGGYRPDMLVHLPKKGIIPVDAKVPMQAYLDAQQAGNEKDMREKLQAHAKSLQTHVNALAKKEYWSQFESAPDFVVMLVPYESGLTAAFHVAPELFDKALENHVLIASPVTLLALLRTVSMGWLQLKLDRNAQAIAAQGREIAGRFSKFWSHLGGMGKHLNSAVDSYNSVMGSAETRLIPSLRKISDMTGDNEDVNAPPMISGRARQSRVVLSDSDSE